MSSSVRTIHFTCRKLLFFDISPITFFKIVNVLVQWPVSVFTTFVLIVGIDASDGRESRTKISVMTSGEIAGNNFTYRSYHWNSVWISFHVPKFSGWLAHDPHDSSTTSSPQTERVAPKRWHSENFKSYSCMPTVPLTINCDWFQCDSVINRQQAFGCHCTADQILIAI